METVISSTPYLTNASSISSDAVLRLTPLLRLTQTLAYEWAISSQLPGRNASPS